MEVKNMKNTPKKHMELALFVYFYFFFFYKNGHGRVITHSITFFLVLTGRVRQTDAEHAKTMCRG